ncbi:MAG TPA: hypothetical protein VFI37_06890 [Gaiellaceae bacterium]|nr:hypothetical protein [Gaiellaceae bacterium]
MRVIPAAIVALAIIMASGCGSASPGTLRLTCADSKGAPADLATLPSPTRVGRLYLPSLRNAAEAKLVSWGDGFGWKQYAIVAPGPRRPVVVTLLGSNGDAGLLYGEPVDPSTYRLAEAYRRVSFGSCGGESAGYPGGIVVRRPGCVRLRIEGAQPRRRELTVAIGTRTCAS